MSACAQPDAHQAAAFTPCQIDAWVASPEPQGVTVHEGPSAADLVLGRLPPMVSPEGGRPFGVEVRVRGASKGWLLIEGATDDPARSGLPARETFSGRGWVDGAQLSLRVQSGAGHAQPDAASIRLLDLGDDALSDMGRVQAVLSCSGEWAQLRYRIERTRDPQTARLSRLNDPPAAAQTSEPAHASTGTAWFTRICGNQETTCDGK